ncbi:hypothetical protein SAMN05192558_112133 [Actinokineospora alba]|uniref:Secreted protein n=1 Tax=Actinokineospora alba TaxID=504798 RepID=A0A1H0UX83_9PSEU|nr:hypothetical protein [Actinokineospora alba]TDP68996.1 hypothetical protein C8E96_4566 [Actinokineospora alba]SDI77033.1 hypothetical protein SAMN05421871_107271 [Actinokineospora alba]SDP70862.1 hypothetical protein SAMN05192558_112133 [Actinokineospora alba]
MSVRTWRSAAALAIVALFFASGTVIAAERPGRGSLTSYLVAHLGCLSVSPPEGYTDPGGWRRVIALSPAADHIVLVLVSRSSDLRLCSSRPGESSRGYCPASGSDMVDKRFLGCLSTMSEPGMVVVAGGVAPEVGALVLLLPDGTTLDAEVAGGAFVVAGPAAVDDHPDSLRVRVSDHDGAPLYEGPLFRPPGVR